MKRNFVKAAVVLLLSGFSVMAVYPANALADDIEDLLNRIPGATPTPAPTPQGDQRTTSPNVNSGSETRLAVIWNLPGSTEPDVKPTLTPTFPPPGIFPGWAPNGSLAQLIEVPDVLIPHPVPQQRDDCPASSLECVPPANDPA